MPSLGTREALVIGVGVPTVTRLRFEALPENCIPRSQAEWSGDLGRADKIDDRTIAGSSHAGGALRRAPSRRPRRRLPISTSAPGISSAGRRQATGDGRE